MERRKVYSRRYSLAEKQQEDERIEEARKDRVNRHFRKDLKARLESGDRSHLRKMGENIEVQQEKDIDDKDQDSKINSKNQGDKTGAIESSEKKQTVRKGKKKEKAAQSSLSTRSTPTTSSLNSKAANALAAAQTPSFDTTPTKKRIQRKGQVKEVLNNLNSSDNDVPRSDCSAVESEVSKSADVSSPSNTQVARIVRRSARNRN